MSINEIRSALRKTNVFLGDVRALQTGKIGQRIFNRVVGRLAARAMSKIWSK